ncbi:kelch-like protein 28 isoform X2 [Pecten maximus]|nr:kelch-like protein 28 isoform X2 [Pecten maximus]
MSRSEMEVRAVTSNASSTAFKLQLVSNPGYPKALLKSLYKSWQEGEFCDITLHVGDKSIRAHKNVLASLPEYFKVLLHMDVQNRSDVKLHDVDFGSLELLLKFAYTGSVEVTGENVQNLFIVADYLQVEFVRRSCERLLLKSVDKNNCVSMLLFALKFYLENIKNRCLDLIGRNLEELSQSEEFLSIPYDCVLDLISNDTLIVFRGGYPLPNGLNELAILKTAICYIMGQNEKSKINGEQTYSLIVAARLIYIDYCEWEKTVESHSDILLAENLSTVRQYLLDHKDVNNKTFLMSLQNSRSPPFCWDVRQDEENIKIVPDRKKYSFKSECSTHALGYFR